MYTLKTEHSFDAAHFLYGYEGKCSNIHGHRWRVVLEVSGEKLTDEGQMRGMLIDFGDLKKDLKEEVDYLDHCLIIEKGSLKETTLAALESENFRILQFEFRPTAENMAKYFYIDPYLLYAAALLGVSYTVTSLTVYPLSCILS